MLDRIRHANNKARDLGTSAGGWLHSMGGGFFKVVGTLIGVVVVSGLCLVGWLIITTKTGDHWVIGKFPNGSVEEYKGGRIPVEGCSQYITRYDIVLHERMGEKR